MKLISVLNTCAVMIMFLSSAVMAETSELETDNNAKNAEEMVAEEVQSEFVAAGIRLDNRGWQYLGCTDYYECQHEADHHGYHHSRVRLSHHCQDHDHHRPYACYGR